MIGKKKSFKKDVDTCLAGVSFSESSEYSSGLLKSTVSKEAEGMGISVPLLKATLT